MIWRKSSFSSNGSACVEVGWRKSSFSSPNGDCVEVAPVPPGVAVRDSKNTSGPTLAFPTPDWRGFLGGLKCHEGLLPVIE
jgi:hypothetical protein